MFIFCRVLCFHSPYHKTHVIYLTRDKSTYHHQSNVPPQPFVCPPVITAVTVRKVDRDRDSDYVADFPAVFFHISHWYLSWNKSKSH